MREEFANLYYCSTITRIECRCMINKGLRNNKFSDFNQMYGEEKKQEGDVRK